MANCLFVNRLNLPSRYYICFFFCFRLSAVLWRFLSQKTIILRSEDWLKTPWHSSSDHSSVLQFGAEDRSNVPVVFRAALVPVSLWLWYESSQVCINCCWKSQASLPWWRRSWTHVKSRAWGQPRQVLGTGRFCDCFVLLSWRLAKICLRIFKYIVYFLSCLLLYIGFFSSSYLCCCLVRKLWRSFYFDVSFE